MSTPSPTPPPGPAHDPDPDALHPVDRLIADCIDRWEDEGDKALEDACAAHPEHAALLRHRVDLLLRAGLLQTEGGAETFPATLGEFRLLQPLGGGGMGVVYLARQESLEREVALKLIRPEQLYFPGARARFQREVQTVAQLQHPGIVPVFTVGEEQGLPYFAMERVRGATLAEILEHLEGRDPAALTGADLADAVAAKSGEPHPQTRPEIFAGDWSTTCLRLVREVCDALEHTHRNGVLHRDLKPSNVMVTPGGRVLLLDFGLATAEGDVRLTRSGSRVGSLAYMAPELLDSTTREYGPAHDVYSLGVTLYELLALRLPFRSATATTLRAEILLGRVPSLRARNANISWETETVCLTAMDPEASRRYSSASDFGRDLGNVLARRPIEARRASALHRARRWVQRHPAAALATALGALLVVGGPTAWAVVQSRSRARVEALNEQLSASLDEETRLRAEAGSLNESLAGALAEVQRERTEAKNQAERAGANFRRALAAVDGMLHRVGSQDLAYVPEMAPVRAALLADAVELYHQLGEGNPSDATLRGKVADALLRLAALTGMMREFETSERSIAEQIRIDRSLVEEDPGRDAERIRLSHGLAVFAQIVAMQDRMEQAEELAREGVAALSELEPETASADVLRALSQRYHALANILSRRGDLERALAQFQEAADVARELAWREGAGWEDRYALGQALNGVGGCHSMLGHQREAETTLREAIATYEELEREAMQSLQLQVSLTDARYNLALQLRARGESTEAEALLRAALEDQLELIRLAPSIPDHRSGAAAVRRELGGILGEDPARRTEAEQLLRDALEYQEQVVAEAPDSSEYRSNLGSLLGELAGVVQSDGRAGEAVDFFERATTEQRRALASNPGQLQYELELVEHELGRARALQDLGRHAESVEVVQGLLEAEPARTLGNGLRCLERGLVLARASGEEPDRAALEAAYCAAAAGAVRAALDAGTLAPDELVRRVPAQLAATPVLRSLLDGDG